MSYKLIALKSVKIQFRAVAKYTWLYLATFNFCLVHLGSSTFVANIMRVYKQIMLIIVHYSYVYLLLAFTVYVNKFSIFTWCWFYSSFCLWIKVVWLDNRNIRFRQKLCQNSPWGLCFFDLIYDPFPINFLFAIYVLLKENGSFSKASF